MTQQTQDVLALRGQDLMSQDGDKLGTIEEIYLDTDTNQPEWALIVTGLFGSKLSFVPISSAARENDAVTVPFDKATVKDAPNVDPDGQLSESEEQELYRHYGMGYGNGGSGSGTNVDRDDDDAVGHDASGPTTDDAMTRSEEELRVGTMERESGRVRLKKYVVEDEVTRTVPVRREEARLEREPITDGNVGAATDGPAISEEEHEVVLHEEEPVIQKQAVPKERVRLDKDAPMHERQVSDTIRKEQIEVDDTRGAR
jgi:uncharacterized protein (TIGR02271 family)